MITKINHEIRKTLELDIESFVVADVLNQMKRPVSLEEVADEVCMRAETLRPVLLELVERGFVEVGKRSHKFSTTSSWKQSVKEKKVEKETDGAIHLMKLVILDTEKLRINDFSDYAWDGRESEIAGRLADKLRFSIKAKSNLIPSDQEVADAFGMMLDLLPEWNVKNFSLSRLVSDYNGIMSQIKSKPKKRDLDNLSDSILDA